MQKFLIENTCSVKISISCEPCESWAEIFQSTSFMRRCDKRKVNSSRPRGYSRNILLLWNKLLIANLSLFIPTLWFIAVLSWKEFFHFCLFPSCIIDNNRTLLIFPFTMLNNIILLQSSGWEYLYFLNCFHTISPDNNSSFLNMGHWKCTHVPSETVSVLFAML